MREVRNAALLGGTTTLGDCAAGIAHLARRERRGDGPVITAFEREFARTVGAAHAIAFAAGRVALYEILRSLGIGHGDEVLLQLPTHVVVANAVRYTGARAVYVDCRLGSYDIDLEEAERRVTPRTRALIVQHTFGIPADLDGSGELSRRHGLELIEDCVHSLGATYRGRPLGSFGRAAFFSTEETKTISTTMGGVAVTTDPDLARRLRDFQDACAAPPASLTARHVAKLVTYHVLTQPHVHRYTRAAYEMLGSRRPLPGPTSGEEARGLWPDGYERRLGDAQAAVGLRQLRRLDGNIRHRTAVAQIYAAELRDSAVRTPRPPSAGRPAYVRYPVQVPDRDAAVRALRPHAVPGLWFTSVLEEAASPEDVGYAAGTCPNAEICASKLVNLPTHPRVAVRQARGIARALSREFPAA
jgi:perosamine synthetase